MVVLPFFYVFGKSLLNSHFAVGGSVVINNKKDDFGGNKLFALVTPKDNKFSAMTLMCKLEKKLPRYKVPSGVIPIRAIPKKANGKIDRTKCLELLAN
jgi:acyl-CoA synthetase (AMP-forming)/AMP-acid ligase II